MAFASCNTNFLLYIITRALQRIECPASFDDLYCWPPASAGSVVSISCAEILGTATFPETFRALVEAASAYRKCGTDGAWDWNNWTNYSECLVVLTKLAAEEDESKEMHGFSVLGAVLGHLVLVCSFCSFFALVTAIAVFVSLRSIACTRIKVHKNLCIALLLHCFALIIISSQIVFHPHASADSPLYVRHVSAGSQFCSHSITDCNEVHENK